jgi:metal-responsive CopG/Arc/MetJ family transcriptional regulator
MRTIAITIEDDVLNRIDQLAERLPQKANRSKIIREAVREYLIRVERMREEEREREIFRKNRKRLARQAEVLVKEQAKP